MKHLTIIILFVFISATLRAQRPSDKLFEKMALQKGISMFSFSKEMLDAVDLNFDDDDGNDEHHVTGDLHEVKVMIYKVPEEIEPIDFRAETLKYLPVGKFKVIEPDEHDINVDDGSCDIRIFKKGSKIKECHILFKGDVNGVLLSFFGDFKIDDVKEMADKLENYK